MSQQTENYNFNLIETTDKITDSLTGLNSNFTALDTILENLSGGITELTSPVRIWGMDDGLYKLPQDCVIYYYGTSNTTYSLTLNSIGYMFVTSHSTDGTEDKKQFYILCGNGGTARNLSHGYSSSTGGSMSTIALTGVLTSISTYVKNQLDYSTSDTTYALSAYQGYVLKGLIDTLTTGKQNTITASTTDLIAGTSSLNTGDIYVVFE